MSLSRRETEGPAVFSRFRTIRDFSRQCLQESAMKRSFGLILIIPLFLALAGCSGDADKGILQHKEKAVPPPPEKPAPVGQAASLSILA